MPAVPETCRKLSEIYLNFSQKDVHLFEQHNLIFTQSEDIKAIEKTTNHDIKAIEYFLKDKIIKSFEGKDTTQITELIHFGLTSQDINNTAIPLAMKQAMEEV